MIYITLIDTITVSTFNILLLLIFPKKSRQLFTLCSFKILRRIDTSFLHAIHNKNATSYK